MDQGKRNCCRLFIVIMPVTAKWVFKIAAHNILIFSTYETLQTLEVVLRKFDPCFYIAFLHKIFSLTLTVLNY